MPHERTENRPPPASLRQRSLLLAALLLLLLVGCSGGGTNTGETGGGNTVSEETSASPTGGETSAAEESAEGEAARMDVREAVGQMFVVGMAGTEPDRYVRAMIRDRNIGGVLLFGYNLQGERQTRALTDELQRLSLETDPRVPPFVAVDHEGGEVAHAPWVAPEPSAAELGARGDPEEARAASERIGRALLRAGVNTNLAPVVDTGAGAAIGSRSFGADPDLVGRMGAAAVEGYEAAGIVSSAKHFPNHGPARSDSHVARPVVDHDLETVRAVDLPPFRAAADAGVPMVMVGHLLYPHIDPDNPASLSPDALRLLREELGFEGVVITDDLSMEGALQGGSTARAAVDAASAGADVMIVSGSAAEQAEAHEAVVRAVESGEIPREQVDASVERILEVKREKLPAYWRGL